MSALADAPQITADPLDAGVKFEAYKEQVVENLTDREKKLREGAMRANKALLEGWKLLDLRVAMEHGGCDEKGRPNFAIARATQEFVWWSSRHEIFTTSKQIATGWSGPRARRSYHNTPVSREWFGGAERSRASRAMVPSIPPELRPKGKLHQYHILFEADWEDVPVDPFLLRHCHGTIYVVVAHWALTELERSLLANL